MEKSKMGKKDLITLILLVAMSVFLYADQRIMSAILPELTAEYGADERILGFIGSAFTLVGAAISIFFGFYTDKVSRKKLLIATVLIGELPCLLTGIPFFTPTLGSFTLLRILTGIGIGGIYPITFSLISDYFSEKHRATASAWVGAAWAIGMLTGPALAGYLTLDFGWRLPFILAAAPNFPLVILFALIARDPERGQTEAELQKVFNENREYTGTISLSDFKTIFSNKTNLFTFLQGIPGTIPWGILSYWLILFLEKERGFPKTTATNVYLLLGVGTILGSVIFAILGQKLYRKDPRLLPIACGSGILLGIIPAAFIINLPLEPTFTSQIIFYTLAFLTGILVSVPMANVKAIIMNVNRPENRGSAFAVFNITDNLGQGFGPALGGLLIPLGFLFTLNFSIAWWLPCGLLFFMIARFLKADRDTLKEYLKEKAESILEE